MRVHLPDLINRNTSSTIIVLISIVAAAFLGLIATTADIKLFGLAIALIFGGILLAYPLSIVWIVLFLGLMITGILPLYFDSGTTKITWGVSLLGFLLFALASLKAVVSPEVRKDMPAFLWIALCFVIYATLNTLIQWHSFEEVSGGFKRYFQVWGLMFTLYWINFDGRNIQQWRLFFLVVALIQLPVALYERLVYVPIREGIKHLYPGMVPIDVVGGTFGASSTGGGASAEMGLFLIMILAFLLAQYMEKLLTANKLLLLAPIIIAPLFLGEIKAIVVMIPLMFLVLYREKIYTHLHQWLLGAIGMALLVIAVSYNLANLNDNNIDISEMIERALSYNVGDQGYGNYYLNRTTVLTFWIDQQGLHNPISFVFGNGMGSVHSTDGHISRDFPLYGLGLTAASSLLWDLGLFGLISFYLIIIAAWSCADKIRCETSEPPVRADIAAIQVGLALFSFYIFYRPGILGILSIQIVFTMMLGYLGWLYRKHSLSSYTKQK